MKALMIFVLVFPVTILTTRERAANMFRAPSSTRPLKIERKFQPIDHTIKGTSGSSQTEQRKNF
jgi:hypothetical protein